MNRFRDTYRQAIIGKYFSKKFPFPYLFIIFSLRQDLSPPGPLSLSSVLPFSSCCSSHGASCAKAGGLKTIMAILFLINKFLDIWERRWSMTDEHKVKKMKWWSGYYYHDAMFYNLKCRHFACCLCPAAIGDRLGEWCTISLALFRGIVGCVFVFDVLLSNSFHILLNLPWTILTSLKMKSIVRSRKRVFLGILLLII